MICTVGPTEATVLILGESGTGKELIAGAVHQASQRREENYVRLNCAAIPESLLESELFGHEKGAFTGAVKQKIGQVEEANEGTLFLDEIGEMSRSLQAKLLRFLEDGTFVRVGGTEEQKVNVRIVAATNRDIIEAIEEGEFREDLYHRLNVVPIELPKLSSRTEDIPLLIKYFNISTDPRLLKSMKQEYGGNSITYTKETWFEFIIKTYGKYIDDNIKKMREFMRFLSMSLPTDDIWKYLYALKKFESN